MKRFSLLMIAGYLSACSPVMEMNRPDPVNLDQFTTGEKRIDVIASLGTPTGNIQDQGNNCDVYKLYTRGVNGAGKGAIAFGEGATDIVTLGLAEIIWTPIEASTRNVKHTVIFCYDADGKLVSFTKSDEPAVGD